MFELFRVIGYFAEGFEDGLGVAYFLAFLEFILSTNLVSEAAVEKWKSK